MIKRIIITALIVFTSFTMFSQTRDVTLTISPYAEHVWWNKNTTLDNSTFWGARAGFSFGPLFEIRGFYQKSSDIKASMRSLDWGITNDWADKMSQSNVDIERYGGEIKLNLMNNGFFAPYITVGGGIQNMSYQLASTEALLNMGNIKDEKIFGAIGLGTKFNLSDRIVLSLEAKNTFFNVNDKSYFLKPDYDISKEGSKRLGNWSAMASLDFYLGGTKSSNDEVHRAYEKMFSDGFAGMKFVIEPGLTYIKLEDESLFDEQYFLGASAGFDFSSLVGVRGFYYQATDEPGKVSLNFNNKLSMYGANIIARLNQPRGVNPYLVLGGGYLNTNDDYINTLGEKGKQSRGFAMGGVGIEIPLSKYIALYGNVNAMITNEVNKDLSTIETKSQVKTSMMYQTGLRFNIGKSANTYILNDRELEKVSRAEEELNNQQVNELRMTPDELSRIVRDAVKETRDEYENPAQIANEEIEVQSENEEVAIASEQTAQTRAISEQNSINNDVVKEIARANEANSKLEKQLDELNKSIESQLAVISGLRDDATLQQIDNNKMLQDINKANKKMNPKSPFMKLNRVSVLASMDFGSQFFWNIGTRGHMQIKNSNFDFMPELYLTFGKKTSLGASANVLYTFKSDQSSFSPYLGLGYGAFPGAKTVWGTNVIVGTNFKTALGTVFMDYSVRSSFKQNQIAVGYRFSF